MKRATTKLCDTLYIHVKKLYSAKLRAFFRVREGFHFYQACKPSWAATALAMIFPSASGFVRIFSKTAKYYLNGKVNCSGTIRPSIRKSQRYFEAIAWFGSFRNVFLAPPLNLRPESTANEVSVYEVSSAPYLPETWYYHQLRYNAEEAMLEVSTDERPEGITYTTVNREPGGVRTSLLLSNPELSRFSIGSRYFGLMETWGVVSCKRKTNTHLLILPAFGLRLFKGHRFGQSQCTSSQNPSSRLRHPRIANYCYTTQLIAIATIFSGPKALNGSGLSKAAKASLQCPKTFAKQAYQPQKLKIRKQ